MRGLVYHGAHDVRYETVSDPVLEDARSVIVRVEACAICGSDLHIYHGHGFTPDTGYCVGHEAIGEIVETGAGVRRFRTGERVIVAGGAACGQCDGCLAGVLERCTGIPRVFGLGHALQGGQADAVMVPAADTTLLAMPDGLSDEQGLLLTDNLPTAYFGATRADVGPGRRVAVVGCGPVGLLAIESAFVLGASVVYAIDLVPERRAAAAALGAIPVEGDDPQAFIADHADGQLPESVIEAVGADASIALALQLAAPRGTVSVVGAPRALEFSFPMLAAFARNLSFRVGICPVQSYWPALVPLLQAGRLGGEHVFTEAVPLSEGSEAYRRFAARDGGVLKTLMRP